MGYRMCADALVTFDSVRRETGFGAVVSKELPPSRTQIKGRTEICVTDVESRDEPTAL